MANASTTEQLQIINIDNPVVPKLIFCKISCTLRKGTSSGEETLPAKSIFYYKKRLYIGTAYSISAAFFELHIFDVSSPENPVEIGTLKTYHNVNAIAVTDQMVGGVQKTIAYLALSGGVNTGVEVKAYDFSNPYFGMDDKAANSPSIGSFNAEGTEYGTALFLSGSELFLGREGQGLTNTTLEPELYILDATDPTSITEVEHADLHLSTTSGVFVSGIRALTNTVFVSTTYSKKPFFEYSTLSHSLISLPAWPKYGLFGIDIENNHLSLVGQNGFSLFSPQ